MKENTGIQNITQNMEIHASHNSTKKWIKENREIFPKMCFNPKGKGKKWGDSE